jgi:ADP-ribosylglycohydrolase
MKVINKIILQNFKRFVSIEADLEAIDKQYHSIKSALLGVAVGDALGVPVEFESRQTLQKKPIKDMIGYGTYNQPAGTWSDDSSLTFCLAEALTQEFDIKIIGENFVKWYHNSFWTAHGNVFDIGIATRKAIAGLTAGVQADLAGGADKQSNGNGSLMRILPLVFYIKEKPIEERFELTKRVSAITHRHIRSVVACFYYVEFARQIFMGDDKFTAYKTLKTSITIFLESIAIDKEEIRLFDRLLKEDISKLPEKEIFSSGYVLHTLEASIWCLLTTDSFEKSVLRAVNLGEDTDTTAAVTGGLAGLSYGFKNIPKKWLQKIARHDDIVDLAERLNGAINV